VTASNEGGAFAALVVDYGGVLTTSMTVTFAAFCQATGVNPERMRDLLVTAYTAAGEAGAPANDVHDLVQAVETGRLDTEEFDRRLAVALSEGIDPPLDPAGLTARLLEQLRPDDEMRGAVIQARKHELLTGLISNTWGMRPPADIDGMFDAVVLSGREGVRKPEPEIYLLAARRLGVRPQTCVFVDDVPVNVEGARAVGMAGVLHRAAAITIPKLEGLLGVSLADR
jgi:epoxide hydrolase-like predicted phosphatase